MRTENEEGIDPVITEYADDYEEARHVLASVTDAVNTAVLARTNRQLFIFQRMCLSKGVKYKILGKKDFLDQGEIKRLIKLAKESSDTRPANVVLADLIQRHNLIQIYKHTGDEDESDPVENLNAIVKMSAGKGTTKEFLTYLRKLAYARKSVKGLTLSTGHQAKGREFANVYVVGVNQGKLPHCNGEIGEERRLFFVMCSRAAKTLNISFYKHRSEFLNNYVDRIQVYEAEEV
jgi:superfamily I DNA/RNA helicase